MLLRRLALVATLVLPALLAACGGGSAAPPPAPQPNPASADISVLMFGNSHSASNDLPGTLAAMLRAGRPGKTVSVINAPGLLFLEERLNHAQSMALFNSQKWSAVILQAQKYSSSGQFDYSIEEAVELVRLTRQIPALPIMFPEWPRRGVNESARIYTLHVDIALRQPACVAPIPYAWDLAATRLPSLALHDADGNHANPAGSFLAALVLYATLTGNAPLALPDLPVFGVDSATQAALRQVAEDQLKAVSARQHCPNAPIVSRHGRERHFGV